jgi:hypothetical protein
MVAVAFDYFNGAKEILLRFPTYGKSSEFPAQITGAAIRQRLPMGGGWDNSHPQHEWISIWKNSFPLTLTLKIDQGICQ